MTDRKTAKGYWAAMSVLPSPVSQPVRQALQIAQEQHEQSKEVTVEVTPDPRVKFGSRAGWLWRWCSWARRCAPMTPHRRQSSSSRSNVLLNQIQLEEQRIVALQRNIDMTKARMTGQVAPEAGALEDRLRPLNLANCQTPRCNSVSLQPLPSK